MGTKAKQVTNEKALKNGLKAVEELGIMAPAILRERLIALCEYNIAEIEKNPEPYNSVIWNANQFKKVLATFLNEIQFKD